MMATSSETARLGDRCGSGGTLPTLTLLAGRSSGTRRPVGDPPIRAITSSPLGALASRARRSFGALTVTTGTLVPITPLPSITAIAALVCVDHIDTDTVGYWLSDDLQRFGAGLG